MKLTDVADDGKLRESVENLEPDSDVLTSFCYRTSRLAGELVSVQSDLHPVVEQSKERRQRKRRHEYCYEPEL